MEDQLHMVEQFFRRTLKYKEKDLDEIQVLQLTDSQMPSDAYVRLVFGHVLKPKKKQKKTNQLRTKNILT